MSKTIKLMSVLLIATMVIVSLSNVVCATDANTILSSLENEMKQNTTKVEGGEDITNLAGKIINFLQYAAILAGAVILAVLGIKYMMGSVEEKAEYKKSFVPLIIGIVVVMGAVSIANIIFQTFA